MLDIDNLTIVYPDGTKAVDGLSLFISQGEKVALVGANGAGKTSLILSLVGVVKNSSGTIKADGIQLNKKNLRQIRNRIGVVFQNPDDQLFMPVLSEDIAFGLRNMGLDEVSIKNRVLDTLSRLHIEHLINRSPLNMSGGEKRMAAIATVLAMQPSIMIFDEPTAFLDPIARNILVDTINSLPHTMLISTHDIAFAKEVCPRTAIILDGKIFADKKTKEFDNFFDYY